MELMKHRVLGIKDGIKAFCDSDIETLMRISPALVIFTALKDMISCIDRIYTPHFGNEITSPEVVGFSLLSVKQTSNRLTTELRNYIENTLEESLERILFIRGSGGEENDLFVLDLESCLRYSSDPSLILSMRLEDIEDIAVLVLDASWISYYIYRDDADEKLKSDIEGAGILDESLVSELITSSLDKRREKFANYLSTQIILEIRSK